MAFRLPRDRRRAIPASALVTLLAACGGDTVGPPPAGGTLRITGPSTVAGTIAPEPGDPTQVRFECGYDLRFAVAGGRLTLEGAVLTMQPRTGGDLPQAFTDVIPAAEVAGWLGATELGANAAREVGLRTWFTFAPTSDRYGRTGAHRAIWAFAYNGGDTARYEVECTATMARLIVAFQDRRDNRSIDSVAVELDGHSQVARLGLASLPNEVVAGRYRVRVRDGRYAPVDTMVDAIIATRAWFAPILRLTRLAPQVDGATGASAMDPPTGGWIDVHHPDGTGQLPARLRLVMRDARTSPGRTFEAEAAGTDLDATRRRYTFTADVHGVTDIEFSVPWTGHPDLGLRCRRMFQGGPWVCGDA